MIFGICNRLGICTQCIKFHKDKMDNEAKWVKPAELVHEPTRRTKEAAVETQDSCFADTAEK